MTQQLGKVLCKVKSSQSSLRIYRAGTRSSSRAVGCLMNPLLMPNRINRYSLTNAGWSRVKRARKTKEKKIEEKETGLKQPLS